MATATIKKPESKDADPSYTGNSKRIKKTAATSKPKRLNGTSSGLTGKRGNVSKKARKAKKKKKYSKKEAEDTSDSDEEYNDEYISAQQDMREHFRQFSDVAAYALAKQSKTRVARKNKKDE